MLCDTLCSALTFPRYVAVGSKTIQGKAWMGGYVQDFAYQSYVICCGDGAVWGDGVTPVQCALGKCYQLITYVLVTEATVVSFNHFSWVYSCLCILHIQLGM